MNDAEKLIHAFIILGCVVSSFRDVTHMTESSTTNLFKDIRWINFV